MHVERRTLLASSNYIALSRIFHLTNSNSVSQNTKSQFEARSAAWAVPVSFPKILFQLLLCPHSSGRAVPQPPSCGTAVGPAAAQRFCPPAAGRGRAAPRCARPDVPAQLCHAPEAGCPLSRAFQKHRVTSTVFPSSFLKGNLPCDPYFTLTARKIWHSVGIWQTPSHI